MDTDPAPLHGQLERLVERYRTRGDPETLGELFDLVAPALFRLAVSITADAATAEDVLQETFLAAVGAMDRYDPRRPIRPWLVGILRRQAGKAFRERARTPDPLRLDLPDGPADPATDATRREREAAVRAALEALPAPYRDVALLRWRYGLEPAEIAHVRDLPPATVRSLLHRAREKVRGRLGALAGFLPGSPSPRGLASVRASVLSAAAPAGTAVTLVTVLGAILMTKKAIVLGAAVLLAAAAWMTLDAVRTRTPAAPQERRRGPDGRAVAREETSGSAPGERDPGRPAARSGRIRLPVEALTRRGDPVPAARVEAFPVPDRPTDWSRDLLALTEPAVPAVSAVADAAGRAELEGLGAGTWTIVASAPGFARTGPTGLRLHEEAPPTPLRILLDDGRSLGGRVLDARGRPVADAVVLAWPVDAGWGAASAALRHRTTSDAAGSYRLRGLGAVATWLAAAAPGRPLVLVATLDVARVETFDVRLPGTGALRGRVTRFADGAPLAGTRVVATDVQKMLAVETVTDGDGRYRIDDLPAGMLRTVEVTRKGYVALRSVDARTFVEEGRTTVRDVVMRREARVQGVVRGPDGPLSGARVTVSVRVAAPYSAGYVTRTGVTDASGRFSLGGLEPGQGLLLATAGSLIQPGAPDATALTLLYGSFPEACAVQLEAGRTVERDVDLVPGAAIEGRVLDEGGRAIDGAIVHVAGWEEPTAVSGRDGSFRLAGLQPGRSVRLVARRDGLALVEPTVVAVPSRGDASGAVLRMGAGIRVFGHVSAADGSVPPGIRLRVWGPPTRRTGPGGSRWLAQDVPVAADGTFSTRAAARPGRGFRLELRCPGFVDQRRRVDVPEGGEGMRLDLVLEEGHVVHGRVVAAQDGRPVPGASLSLVRGGDTVLARTDAGGRFELRGLRRGSHPVRVEAPRLVATTTVIAVPAAAEVTVEIERAAPLSGRVVVGDEPAAGVVVEAWRPGAQGAIDTARTGADGGFALRHLPAGSYRLVAWTDPTSALDALPATAGPVETGTRDVRIEMRAGGSISGRVVDPAGDPVAGARIEASRRGATDRSLSAQAVRTAGSAPDGSFALHGLADGSWTLQVVAPHSGEDGYLPLERPDVRPGAHDLDLILRPALSIEGVLLHGGDRPVQEGVVRAVRTDGEGSGVREAMILDGGRFRIPGLEPGTYRILHVVPLHPARSLALPGGEAVAAGTRGLRLRGVRGDSVEGVVTDEQGVPVASAIVVARPANAGEVRARTGPDGSFAIRGLDPGSTLDVVVLAPDRAPAVRHDVRAGTPDLRVALEPGLRASGVLREGGRPVPDAVLVLSRDGIPAGASARTDDRGAFTVKGLLPGEYAVMVQFIRPDGTWQLTRAGTIRAGATGVELRIE